MYCPQCGKELAPGNLTCAACGFISPAAPAPSAAPPSFEQLVSETKHAAKDLAKSTAHLSKRMFSKAQTAAKDPSGSAKKVAHRAAKELEAAAREIDRILRDL
jgi:cell division septum initiation protein DivIVA